MHAWQVTMDYENEFMTMTMCTWWLRQCVQFVDNVYMVAMAMHYHYFTSSSSLSLSLLGILSSSSSFYGKIWWWWMDAMLVTMMVG